VVCAKLSEELWMVSRKTGEHNADTVKMMADAVAMRERIVALEARVLRLESELTAVLALVGGGAAVSVTARPSKGPPAVPRPPNTAKRGGPPPLPGAGAAPPARSLVPRAGAKRGDIDISELAELVESIPPPPRAPRR
jgi:hypothetical protein